MKVYPSDVKDWSADLKASGQRVKPSHPYELEDADGPVAEAIWFLFWTSVTSVFDLFL